MLVFCLPTLDVEESHFGDVDSSFLAETVILDPKPSESHREWGSPSSQASWSGCVRILFSGSTFRMAQSLQHDAFVPVHSGDP